ncbi:MAG: transglycosylase family protein [Nitriliruptoraceae bacterium]
MLRRFALLSSLRAPLAVVVVVPLLGLTSVSAAAEEVDDSDDQDATATDEPVTFVDTSDSSYEEAVLALQERGVINGCEEDRFCPDEAMTREQLSSVLDAALELEPVEEGPFVDLGGSVHAASINAAAAAGLVQGCEDDRFCPSELITREQAASMLAVAFDPVPALDNYFDDLSETHGQSVNRLAEAGIATGCSDPLTAFCSTDPLLRRHAAVFIARAMRLVEPGEITPLEERRAEQEALDAEAEAEAEAERQAEEEQRIAEERLAIWEALAECESNGRWDLNTGNGYYGGLQFALGSWEAVGGSGYPHKASKTKQIYRAELLLDIQGWGAWPACSTKLGYQ